MPSMSDPHARSQAHDAHVGHDMHAGHDAHARRDAHAGHDEHAGHSVEMFRDKFWLSLALTIPTIVWSPMVQRWLGYRAPTFAGSRWISASFGTAVFLYGGLVFLRGARGELADRRPG
jgi:P-type Cu2+ transporter